MALTREDSFILVDTLFLHKRLFPLFPRLQSEHIVLKQHKRCMFDSCTLLRAPERTHKASFRGGRSRLFQV